MHVCEDCELEVLRRTKCHGCDCRVCRDCYSCHRAAQLAGEGCLFHMDALKEKRMKETNQPVKKDEAKYAVLLDTQNETYLRVGYAENGDALLINNNGKTVELVKMDATSLKSRDLQVVPNSSIRDAVKSYLHPLNKDVTISARAEKELTQILNDKEIIEMETAKKNKKPAAAKAAKTKKAKTAKAASNGSARSAEIYETVVQATKKATEAREGSFWAQLGKLAAKPIKLETLITKVAADPAGVRSEKLAKSKDAMLASVRIRVRDAYNRLGFLAKA